MTALVALVPVILLLVLLAIFRATAWLAMLIGALVTLGVAVLVWQVPVANAFEACLLGSATGVWSVDWITFWGVIIFNTLTVTGVFADFQKWLTAKARADVRVQTILLAWAFGALLEGLVGFGYPWAMVAPMLILLGFWRPEETLGHEASRFAKLPPRKRRDLRLIAPRRFAVAALARFCGLPRPWATHVQKARLALCHHERPKTRWCSRPPV